MNLLELLDEQHIFVQQKVSSKKAVFEFIAQTTSQLHPALTEEDILRLLLNRERLGSTAIGHGVAIPHCRIPKNNHCILSITLLSHPIVFEPAEPKLEKETLVDIFFSILAPEEATDEHLQLLSEIASLLQSTQIRAALRACNTSQEVLNLLSQPMDEGKYQWM